MKCKQGTGKMDAILEEIRNRKVIEQTEEEKLEHEIKIEEDRAKREYLEEFRVYPYVYIDSRRVLTRYTDNRHNYLSDSILAERLLLNENKELPFDLRWRLLYYREQMEDFWEQK